MDDAGVHGIFDPWASQSVYEMRQSRRGAIAGMSPRGGLGSRGLT
jgi:hypothetical protein